MCACVKHPSSPNAIDVEGFVILISIQPHLCLPKEIFWANHEILKCYFAQSGKEERLAVPGGQEERRDDGGRG